jgi:hypothetical protein
VRLTRILILAALTAIPAMAMLGAGSASASAFCKTDYKAEGCIGEGLYEPETTLRMTLQSGTEAVFTGASTTKCTGSEVKAKLGANPAEPVSITITSLTFSGCKLSGIISCEIKATHLSWAGAMETLGANNGSLTVTSGGSGNPGASAKCGTLSCEFETSSGEFELQGGKPAALVAKEVTLKRTSGSEACGESVKLSATYKIVEADEPAAAPVENPTIQAGNPAKISPSPIVWKKAGVESATISVFMLGKHSVISQTPNKAAFEMFQTCGGTTIEVKDAKTGAGCTFQIRVLAGNYAVDETANLLTQWQADGAKNAQNINTTLELK